MAMLPVPPRSSSCTPEANRPAARRRWCSEKHGAASPSLRRRHHRHLRLVMHVTMINCRAAIPPQQQQQQQQQHRRRRIRRPSSFPSCPPSCAIFPAVPSWWPPATCCWVCPRAYRLIFPRLLVPLVLLVLAVVVRRTDPPRPRAIASLGWRYPHLSTRPRTMASTSSNRTWSTCTTTIG